MINIESKNLSKSFGSFRALSDLSLNFEAKKIHAVIGENGAGKSTLMKLLFGLLRPDSGEFFVDGKRVEFDNSADAILAGIGMVQQHFCLVENLSALDNIILGTEPTKGLKLDRELALKNLISKLPDESLHVPWHQKVSELSVGFRQRIEILKLLYRDSKFLILDEPTAVLTPQEIASFFSLLLRLKESGRTIVLITHKLAEVFSVCDNYHVLRQGKLIASGVVADTTQMQIVKHMIGRDLNLPKESESVKIQKPKVETSLEFKNVSTRLQQRGQLKNVSLSIMAGEVLGIAGVEGSGQSKLVETLLGLTPFDGELHFMNKKIDEHTSTKIIRDMGLALIPEDRHTQGIWLEESCSKNLIIGIESEFQSGIFFDEAKIRSTGDGWLKEFDVRLSDLSQPISSLSGGNQQKLVFAREILGRKVKLIVCHQPTRGVDLGAIEKIHAEILRMKALGISCLLLSSELDELFSLSDRICVMFDGRVNGIFDRSQFSKNEIGKAMTGASK